MSQREPEQRRKQTAEFPPLQIKEHQSTGTLQRQTSMPDPEKKQPPLKRFHTGGTESEPIVQKNATYQNSEGIISEQDENQNLGVIPTERGQTHPSLWQNDDVIKWLFDIDLTSAVKPFSYHNLDGTDLEEVTEADLASIGIKKLHDRKYLIRCIKKLFGKREAFLVIKNRADHDRILVNDIRVRLLNLDQITFGQVLEQCLKIWHLTGHVKKHSGGSPAKPSLKLDLGYLTANDTYFLGDAEGNVFLNHASIEGLFSESLLSFQDPSNCEQQVVYLHRSSVLQESSVPDSARESLNAAKIEIERSNMSLQQNSSRNQGEEINKPLDTNESDSKYKQSQFSKRSKENTSFIPTPNELVHLEVEAELEETPAHRNEEEKKSVSVDKNKQPFSSDDEVDGVDIYNDEYDDDETIEATRRGSSVYMNAHKVRLYTPSNPSSHAGGISQERNKSKSQFHISDNEDVLTMSDIDVSHDKGDMHGRSIQGTSSIMKQGDVFIDDGKDEEELQILSGSGSDEGGHHLMKVGSRQRYEEVGVPVQFQKYYVKNATITFKEKMNLLKKQDAERKKQIQHAHHSSDVTETKRSNQYPSMVGTMVLQSRMESERFNTEPHRYDPNSEHNYLEPDPITGGGVVTSSGIRSSQTGSQQVSGREYKRPYVEIPEMPEQQSSSYSQYHHSYSRSSVPHTTSHAEQKKVIFEYVNEPKGPNRSNTLDRDYTSVPQGRLLNKLQQDLEQINRDHQHSHDFGAPRSLQAQDISKSPHQTLRSGRSLIGDERHVPNLVSPTHVSHYQLRYGGRTRVPTNNVDVSPVRARLYPTNLERRRF